MELWIRSQGKECLTKVNRLYIRKICGALKEYDKFEINQEDGIVLAIYKTKERALEVLDEIENCLHQKFKLEGSYEDLDIQLKTKMINGLYGYIYSMPEE